jgi:hypothetical protein
VCTMRNAVGTKSDHTGIRPETAVLDSPRSAVTANENVPGRRSRMLKVPTVFVLGAGASEPYGFPTGEALLKDLLASLQGTSSIYNCVRDLGHTQQAVEAFRRALAESGRTSVDAFLEHRPEYLEIGKAAMAARLIPCEIHDRLFADYASGEHWYRYAFNKLSTKFEEWDRNNVAFLTFNYDRSLEYYFTTAIQSAYNKPFAAACEQVKKLRIIHLYGDLGEFTEGDALAWRKPPPVTAARVQDAAGRIHIIHSEVSKEQFAGARALLNDAQVVCFLGFGFHPTNVERLLTDVKQRPDGAALTTAFGLMEAERLGVIAAIGPKFPRHELGHGSYKSLTFLRQHFRWW